MKKWAIRMLVVASLVVLAVLLRMPKQAPLPATPEDAVNAFFDAATRGDDATYLALVDGELRDSLESSRSEEGEEVFRRGLRKSIAGIKGLAVSRADGDFGDQVALDVEIVFVGRTDRQRIVVSPRAGGWIITAIESAESVKQPIPYGTPVFEE